MCSSQGEVLSLGAPQTSAHSPLSMEFSRERFEGFLAPATLLLRHTCSSGAHSKEVWPTTEAEVVPGPRHIPSGSLPTEHSGLDPGLAPAPISAGRTDLSVLQSKTRPPPCDTADKYGEEKGSPTL